MSDSVLVFYDELASDYHLIFEDWHRSVHRQSEVLHRLISRHMGGEPLSILDCSCGIGTQAIGLAMHGHRVHGTDLSRAAVERARGEADTLGVNASFGVADLRTLASQVADTFEVVISCDNSLPHLLTDEDLIVALQNARGKLRPNGLFLASTRDYDRATEERPRVELPRVFDGPEGRRIVFQVWDWSTTGRTYTLQMFIVRQVTGDWKTRCYATEYRALRRRELDEALATVGFSETRWHMPSETGYHRPIVTARRR